MRKLQALPNIDLSIIALAAHLSPEYVHTVEQIRTDGFEVTDTIKCVLSCDSDVGMAKTPGLATLGTAVSLARLHPDLLLNLHEWIGRLGLAYFSAGLSRVETTALWLAAWHYPKMLCPVMPAPHELHFGAEADFLAYLGRTTHPENHAINEPAMARGVPEVRCNATLPRHEADRNGAGPHRKYAY